MQRAVKPKVKRAAKSRPAKSGDQVTGAGLKSASALCSCELLRTGLLAAARNVEHEAEQLPTHLFDRCRACCNRARVYVHQVMPAARQIRARGDLDDGDFRETIRRAAAGREDVQVDAGRKLQGAADEVARRRGGEDQAFLQRTFSPGDNTPEWRCYPI